MDFPSLSKQVEEGTAAMELTDNNDDEKQNNTNKSNENDANDDGKKDDDNMKIDVENNNTPDAPSEENKEAEGNDDNNDGNDDDDNSSKTSTTSSSDNDVGVSPEGAEVLLIKATGLKEMGNTEFKSNELDKAARSYRRGINSLKKINRNNTSDDEQIKGLMVTLYTNLSTVSYKQNKYRVSVQVATKAIQIQNNNVKALYRRAVAQRKLGNLDEARDDLKQAINIDTNNVACKKELIAIKKEIDITKQTQKKALAKAFSGKKNSSFLYNDKEAEEKRKQQEEKQRKKEQEELLKKRKIQWEDECVKRMANNQPAITFEEWEKEEKEKLEKQQKEKEKAQREEQRRRKKASSKPKEESENNSDDELTEAELKMMRGYKKTSDGRTTSYFTRELSADELKHIGDIAPKRLDDRSSQPLATSTTTTANTTTTEASKWNQAGTWEERNTTIWCTEQLEKRLKETTINNESVHVQINKIDDITGEASVAIVSGKKRYIFDYHVKATYEIIKFDNNNNNNNDDKKTIIIASGTVHLPDICSTHHDEIEVSYSTFNKKQPKNDIDIQNVELAKKLLAQQLRISVQTFVQDFNNMY